MANPNIVNVATINGKTAVQNIGTTLTTILDNPTSSNKVIKVNSLLVANIDGSASADVSALVGKYNGSSYDNYYIAFTIAVPGDSTLVLITKDTSIYLEEGMRIQMLASSANDLDAIISYEEIS